MLSNKGRLFRSKYAALLRTRNVLVLFYSTSASVVVSVTTLQK